MDLRGNTGGYMYPMIAGLGPILGEGTAGFFVDLDHQTTPWGYAGGASTAGGTPVQIVASPYTLRHQDPPVAVLFDGVTASSGEATAISFIGRPRTRTFGEATCGLTTGNRAFVLSDGGRLNIADVHEADRTLTAHLGPLVPDESLAASAVVARAVAWLQGQPTGR